MKEVKILTVAEAMQLLAKTLGKPCMYINGWNNYDVPIDLNALKKAAPYLDPHNVHTQVWSDGRGILVFDNEDDMYTYYNQTVGGDGPTESNPYDGPVRVYALTCGADGELQNENT